MGRVSKAYLITIDPYDGHRVIADTASKARWKAVTAFREAFGNRHMSVAEILSRMTTLHLGRVYVTSETARDEVV